MKSLCNFASNGFPLTGRRGWCAGVVVLAAAGGASAQSCGPGTYGVRGYFRLVTAVAGGTGQNEAQIGGTTFGTAPVDLDLTNTNANATGCAVSITGHASAHYGDLRFSAVGTGNSCATNGVIMAIDGSGGGPRADSLDQLTITSSTLPQGTPVDIRITWTLMGSGVVNDPVPQLSVLVNTYAGSQLGNCNGQLHGPGARTCTIPAAVGMGVTVHSDLSVDMGAGSLSGGSPSSATMSADYRLVTNCTLLTPGARFVSCGGGTYGACNSDFDGDGDTGTDADIEAFFACLAGNCCASCGSADFDGDGDVGTDADIEAFFRVLAGGSC